VLAGIATPRFRQAFFFKNTAHAMTDNSFLWVRRFLAVAGAVFLLATPASADGDDDYDGLPPGKGREDVFSYCDACHSAKLVAQQGLSRESWDETLDWMVEEQGMAEPDDEMRALILDYLSEYLNTDHRPAHVKQTP
jgi:hypothetical protein